MVILSFYFEGRVTPEGRYKIYKIMNSCDNIYWELSNVNSVLGCQFLLKRIN